MKTFKRILFSGMSLSLLLLLTGCVGRDKAGNPSGLIWDVLGQPMADSIQFFAKNSGLGYRYTHRAADYFPTGNLSVLEGDSSVRKDELLQAHLCPYSRTNQ